MHARALSFGHRLAAQRLARPRCVAYAEMDNPPLAASHEFTALRLEAVDERST